MRNVCSIDPSSPAFQAGQKLLVARRTFYRGGYHIDNTETQRDCLVGYILDDFSVNFRITDDPAFADLVFARFELGFYEYDAFGLFREERDKRAHDEFEGNKRAV